MNLQTFVDAWSQSAGATIELLGSLEAEQWEAKTDLPGWSMRDIAAHLAHLEHVLVNGEPGNFEDRAIVSADYTQSGVEQRRGRSTDAVLNEFVQAVRQRREQLQSLPEPDAIPDITPGGVRWPWHQLLQNRAIDMWTHEQDIRRAVARPGNLDSLGAHVTVQTFANALGFVLGRKVQAPAGTAVRWVVQGDIPFDVTLQIGADGRARQGDTAADLTLTMSSEDFAILGGGRRSPEGVAVTIDGSAKLANQVLTAMAVTP